MSSQNDWQEVAEAIAKYVGPSFRWPNELSFYDAILDQIESAEEHVWVKAIKAVEQGDGWSYSDALENLRAAKEKQ